MSKDYLNVSSIYEDHSIDERIKDAVREIMSIKRIMKDFKKSVIENVASTLKDNDCGLYLSVDIKAGALIVETSIEFANDIEVLQSIDLLDSIERHYEDDNSEQDIQVLREFITSLQSLLEAVEKDAENGNS